MTRAYGSGSVFQRASDNRWVGAVDVGGKRRTVYGKTQREAQRKVDKLRAGSLLGLTVAPTNMTVGQHLRGWLAAVEPTVRPSTFTSYEGHVRLHLAPVARVPLARLAPNDIRVLLGELRASGLSPRTVGSVLTTLRMALKMAVNDGLLPRNVATMADPPAVVRRELTIPTVEEVRRLLALDSPCAPLWAVLVGTGLRLGEALGLRWSDVDPSAATLTVRVALVATPRRSRPGVAPHARTGKRLVLAEPKTSAGRRTVGLPAVVIAALAKQRAAQADRPASILGLVFTTPKGTPLDSRNVDRTFKADCGRAGLAPMRIHDLRHTAASFMLAQGATLDDVKRVLGHASIAMTSDTYGHLVPGRATEVARAMDRALG